MPDRVEPASGRKAQKARGIARYPATAGSSRRLNSVGSPPVHSTDCRTSQ